MPIRIAITFLFFSLLASSAQGIPSTVVGFAASLQATEVLRILTGAPSALRGHLLVADIAEMRFSTVSLQTIIPQ